ncbi:uncharacterized protein LOC144452083 [Glandiceps talaboti]
MVIPSWYNAHRMMNALLPHQYKSPPVVTSCPADITVIASPGSTNSASVVWPLPSAIDNAGPIVSMEGSANPGDIFESGTTTVQYHFTDQHDNTAACTFTVTVLEDSTTWEDIWYNSTDPILGVGRDNFMYVRPGLHGLWYGPIPNSCCIQDVTIQDNIIIGIIRSDYRVWTKTKIDEPWEGPDLSSCCITSISVVDNGTQWAVGVDQLLQQRTNFNEPWHPRRLLVNINKIYHLPTEMILATSTDKKLLSCDLRIDKEWQVLDDTRDILDVVVTSEGIIVGFGDDGHLYTKSDFSSSWERLESDIDSVAVIAASNGKTEEGVYMVGSDSGCSNSRYLRQDSGRLTSAGYDSSEMYPNKIQCTWEIVVPIGKVVTLSFEDLDIEVESTCSYDRITINDMFRKYEFCGQDIPPDVVSIGNHVTVEFVSDKSIRARGFSVTYQSGGE